MGMESSLLEPVDFVMTKSSYPSVVSSHSTSRVSMREIDGRLDFTRFRSSSIVSRFPSTTILTPASPRLRTYPVSPRDLATRYTNGLNPTPWTIPVTWVSALIVKHQRPQIDSHIYLLRYGFTRIIARMADISSGIWAPSVALWPPSATFFT